jgi:transposase
MAILTVGIDTAKSVFAVHGVDAAGKVQLRQPKVARAKLTALVGSLPPCTIGIEACSGAHHWARQFQAQVHTVRLMAPKLVTPYRMSGKKGKNDAADAAAICEAVSRPNMRFVPVKSEEQQSRLMVHRARQGFVAARTACINRIRGLLSEFGIVLPLKAEVVRCQAREHLEDLPGYANQVIGDLLSEVSHLDERIKQYDGYVRAMAKECTAAQQLMQLMGVGETTATAIVAMVGNGREFDSGRQFAAWIGLVPGQYSSGGKARLGRITKAGDAYLRSLLVLGARSVLNAAIGKTDSLSRWALQLRERRGYWKAVVAIAAKNARMAWAVLTRGESFKLPA